MLGLALLEVCVCSEEKMTLVNSGGMVSIGSKCWFVGFQN